MHILQRNLTISHLPRLCLTKFYWAMQFKRCLFTLPTCMTVRQYDMNIFFIIQCLMFLELRASLTFTYLSHSSCFLNHQLLTIFSEALMVKHIKPNGDACVSRTSIIIVLGQMLCYN